MTHNSHLASPRILVDINAPCGLWPDTSRVVETVKSALAEYGVFDDFKGKTVEISLVLADDAFVRELNKTYRNKDKPTNVLSFPQNPEDHLPAAGIGDVILAFETVEKEAKEQQKTFDDHFAHLLIHGILHLLGYDHENDADAEEMEGLETKLLTALGIKNPYDPVAD